jgi:tetratricopeptide (TPR) repeat protein
MDHSPATASKVYLVLLILTMGIWLSLFPPYAKSLETAESTEKIDPETNLSHHQKILFMLLVAEMAASRNMNSLALENYIRAAELTQNPAIAAQSTQLAIEMEAPSEALLSAKLWAKTAPQDTQAQMITVILLIGQSSDQAIPYLKRALDLSPMEVGQHIAAIQSKLPDDSAKNLEEALTKIAAERPKDAYAHLAAAQSAAGLGDIQNAKRWVDSALSITPNLTNALILKTRLIRYEDTSDRKALNFLAKKLEQFPKNSELRLFYASALLDNKSLEEAKKELLRITTDKTFGGQALLFLGEIYLKENKIKEAENVLLKATNFSTSKDAAEYLLGEKEVREGHVDRAIQWFSNVAPGNYHVSAMLRAVELLKVKKAYKDAIYLLHNSSPSTLGEQKQLLLAEIDLLTLSKQTEEAFELANDILVKLPDDEEVLFVHATTASKLAKWETAERDLKKILKQNPNNANALNALGYILSFQKDRLQESLGYLQQALALSPNNPAFMDSMGLAYFRLGNFEKAIKYLRKANNLSDEGEISAHLGEALWMNDRKSDAISVWKKALTKHPEDQDLKETLNRLQVDLANPL